MGCRGCGGRRARAVRQTRVFGSQQAQTQANAIDDADFVMVRYMSPNKGKHQVTGHALFSQPIPGWRMQRRSPESWSINYGYRGGGSKFLVHRDDADTQPGMFVPVETQRVVSAPEEARVIEPPKPIVEPEEELLEVQAPSTDGGVVTVKTIRPEDDIIVTGNMQPVPTGDATNLVDSILSVPTGERYVKFDLQTLPGVNSAIARQLEADGIDSREKLLELGVEGLQHYRGVGAVRAQRIVDAIKGLE